MYTYTIYIYRYSSSSNMWHVLQLRFVQFVLYRQYVHVVYTYIQIYSIYICMQRVQIVVVNDESYTTSRMEWKVVVVLHLEYDYNAKALPFSCSIVPIPFSFPLLLLLPLLLLVLLPCLVGFPLGTVQFSSDQFNAVQLRSCSRFLRC